MMRSGCLESNKRCYLLLDRTHLCLWTARLALRHFLFMLDRRRVPATSGSWLVSLDGSTALHVELSGRRTSAGNEAISLSRTVGRSMVVVILANISASVLGRVIIN